MRISERNYSDDHWEKLFRHAIELGITTFHVSSEYETHARFASLLQRFRTANLQFVAKLADPHFGETRFDAERVRARIEAYLSELRIERLDVVQWMWRGDLKQEQTRLDGFREQRAEITSEFDSLRASGAIGCVAPFPYSVGFAEAVLAAGSFDALTVYLNPLEQEMAPFVPRARDQGMSILALRPFAATKALAARSASQCLSGVLAHSNVCTAVASVSSLEHLTALEEAARLERGSSS